MTPLAQVFKICLDYWNFFVPDVYASVTTGLADGSASFAFVGAVPPPGPAAAGRKQLYREVLSRLRLLMITRMAKPEEVRGSSHHVQQMLWPAEVYCGWQYTRVAARRSGAQRPCSCSGLCAAPVLMMLSCSELCKSALGCIVCRQSLLLQVAGCMRLCSGSNWPDQSNFLHWSLCRSLWWRTRTETSCGRR